MSGYGSSTPNLAVEHLVDLQQRCGPIAKAPSSDRDPMQHLLDLATERQWSIEHALDWTAFQVDPLSPAIRRAMSQIYGDVLYSEQFGLRSAFRMCELAPEGVLRRFAEVQRVEETRHVAFFERLGRLLEVRQSPSAQLLEVEEGLASATQYDELMLHSYVLEAAAQTLFIATSQRGLSLIGRGIRLPGSSSVAMLLRSILQFVAADESRHVAFGMRYLRAQLRELPSSRRTLLERRAREFCELIFQALAKLAPAYRVLGTSPAALLERLWFVLSRRLSVLDIDLGPQPQQLI
jgi:hypothetical protein